MDNLRKVIVRINLRNIKYSDYIKLHYVMIVAHKLAVTSQEQLENCSIEEIKNYHIELLESFFAYIKMNMPTAQQLFSMSQVIWNFFHKKGLLFVCEQCSRAAAIKCFNCIALSQEMVPMFCSSCKVWKDESCKQHLKFS